MRSMLSALVTAVLAASAAAVTINLYPNSVSCGAGPVFECSNVAQLTCCIQGGNDIFSAECVGLQGEAIPDVCVIAEGPRASLCGTTCNSGSGPGTVCLDPGACPAATGAFWFTIIPKVDGKATGNATCQGTVKPDTATFPNGQKFRINHNVPEDVTALLLDLAKNDPFLSEGIPEAILPYEIKSDEEA